MAHFDLKRMWKYVISIFLMNAFLDLMHSERLKSTSYNPLLVNSIATFGFIGIYMIGHVLIRWKTWQESIEFTDKGIVILPRGDCIGYENIYAFRLSHSFFLEISFVENQSEHAKRREKVFYIPNQDTIEEITSKLNTFIKLRE